MHFNGYDIVLLCPEGFDYEDRANQALKICDAFLGDGLYSKERIDEICRKEHHYFYLIKKAQEAVGIYYCYADFYETVDFLGDINVEGIESGVYVGIGQSIALKEDVRRQGLSEWMLNYCTDLLFQKEHVSAIFIPAWKKGEEIPAKNHLEKCAYKLIHVAKQPWANYESLSCPFCKKQRCICDGAIFMRKEKNNG